MGDKKVINALVEGGKATAGPPLGPALGPLGVNVLMIVNRINELTKEFEGMKVPVDVSVDTETKEFDVTVGIPTTAALIAKELGIPKGSGTPSTQKVGDLKVDQVISIAQVKLANSMSTSLKNVVKEVLGTCVSIGVTVEGRDPREVIKDVNGGKYVELN